jgi:hypothetical protein
MKLILFFWLVCFAVQASAATMFRKVLFLGNSITKHGPKGDIDWTGNWGMAASAESKDYVHLVTKALAEKQGAAPEVLVKNIADFEREYADYDIATKLKEVVDFQADLIILAIGLGLALLIVAASPKPAATTTGDLIERLIHPGREHLRDGLQELQNSPTPEPRKLARWLRRACILEIGRS